MLWEEAGGRVDGALQARFQRHASGELQAGAMQTARAGPRSSTPAVRPGELGLLTNRVAVEFIVQTENISKVKGAAINDSAF